MVSTGRGPKNSLSRNETPPGSVSVATAVQPARQRRLERVSRPQPQLDQLRLQSLEVRRPRRQEEQAKINALKGDNSGSWGNQMRSYVLAPYQMVKDLRNNHETGNTSAVLNGEIDDFIEAGIRWRRSSSHA